VWIFRHTIYNHPGCSSHDRQWDIRNYSLRCIQGFGTGSIANSLSLIGVASTFAVVLDRKKRKDVHTSMYKEVKGVNGCDDIRGVDDLRIHMQWCSMDVLVG